MLSLPASVRIFLFGGNIDMRKGFDGLATLVRSAGHDVFSGHLFVFVSREANRVKDSRGRSWTRLRQAPGTSSATLGLDVSRRLNFQKLATTWVNPLCHQRADILHRDKHP